MLIEWNKLADVPIPEGLPIVIVHTAEGPTEIGYGYWPGASAPAVQLYDGRRIGLTDITYWRYLPKNEVLPKLPDESKKTPEQVIAERFTKIEAAVAETAKLASVVEKVAKDSAARVDAFLAEAKKLFQKMKADATPAPGPTEFAGLSVGDRVRVLTTRGPVHNHVGKYGTVYGFSNGGGYATVNLSSGEIVSFQPDELALVDRGFGKFALINKAKCLEWIAEQLYVLDKPIPFDSSLTFAQASAEIRARYHSRAQGWINELLARSDA